MWIKKEEHERLKVAERERDALLKDNAALINELMKYKNKSRAPRSLGMVREEMQYTTEFSS